MADHLHYQWPRPLHEHNSFINVTFNNLLININLAKQLPDHISTHAILAFIVPILLNFIQIKFPAINVISSPFETHQATTMVAIASLLAYCLAVGARLRFPTHNPTYSRFAMVFSGSLSVASLLSLLLPDTWQHVPYVMFIFYFMGHFFGFVRVMLCQLPIYQRVVHAILYPFLARQRHRHVTRTRTLLPLTAMSAE